MLIAETRVALFVFQVNAVKMVDNYLPCFEAQHQIDTAGEEDIEGQIDRVRADIAARRKNVTSVRVFQRMEMALMRSYSAMRGTATI